MAPPPHSQLSSLLRSLSSLKYGFKPFPYAQLTCFQYYFGDRNLPRDKFMQGMLKENKDGWIPVETMLKFNKCVISTPFPSPLL